MQHRSPLLMAGLALALALSAGCGGRKHDVQSQSHAATASGRAAKLAPKVVLAGEKAGKVVKVHATARFVVLNFPVGTLPEQGATLGLFRDGLKVGDARVAGPQLDDNVVADLVSGEAQVGDEARLP